MRYSFQYTLLTFVFCLLFSSMAEARVYLDITSAEFREVPMAVPYFVDKTRPERLQESGKKMADIMSRALTFHGFVSMVDPKSYSGKQQADWQDLGAEFVVLGQYQTKSSGDIVLEIRLVDIHEGRMILGRRYKGSWEKHRQMLLKFCDEIVLKLTGEQGISLSRIAFVSNGGGENKEIYLTDVLGDDIRQVTKHRNLALSPRFSPDGLKLAYTSYHNGNPNLYITDLRQSQKTQPVSRRQGLNMAPAWSPNGGSMAITLSKDGNPDLYLINLEGKIKKRLTSNEGINVSPSWSPDGKQLAFVSDRSGTPQIYIMNEKTKTVRRITYVGNENTTPAWSPKGDWIAYTGYSEGNHCILIIRPEGGAPLKLTQYWGDYESPTWSPDGRQIAFSMKRDGKQQIGAIFRNGKGLRTLFDIKGDQSLPQWSPRLKM